MGAWSSESKSHVATMADGDFRSNEQSRTFDKSTSLRIEWIGDSGEQKTLKESVSVLDGEVVDATVMCVEKLRAFFTEQISDARQQGVLFSLHMKATMMKVSDPIIFGHAVRAYFHDVFAEYVSELDEVGAEPRNGLGNVLSAIEKLPADRRAEIEKDIQTAIQDGPDLAMVNSDKGITNLHVPSDVIIDASMPAMIRTSGQLWNAMGDQQDTKAVIPDSSYAGIYQATIEFCKRHGALDPTTMGTVPNRGAYGSESGGVRITRQDLRDSS